MILMECEDLSPGFTRLKMINHSGEPEVKSSYITINGDIYVSSSLFRSRFSDLSRNTLDKSCIQKGPCATVTVRGQETDQAFCLRPHDWSNKALPWIQRCQHKHWPPESVSSVIIKEGCHVIPISSIPSDPERDSE